MRTIAFAGVLLLTVGGTACSSPQDTARRELGRTLEERAQAREEAEKHVRSGLRARDDGRNERASEWFRSAVESDDRLGEAWLALGVTEMELERLPEAAAALEAASALMPGNPEPAYNLGVIYERLLLYPAAIEAYERALALSDNDLHTMENLARAYIRHGSQPERALELVLASLERERRENWTVWLELQAELLRGRVDEGGARAGR
ncbi:MAG: tetratricopeptide repeat protein [Planctomycetota bacterium]